jgi:hypothetical protein
MFRALLKFLLFVAVIAGVWYGLRFVGSRDDLVATILFEDAPGLETGAEVRLRDEKIGDVREIHSVGGKTAATVHIRKHHRGDVLTDSLFEVGGDPAAIRIVNSIAVGAPVQNGAVIIAKRDRLTTFLAHGGEKLQPHIDMVRKKAEEWVADFDNGKFQRQLDEWKARAPEWKKQGKETFDRNVGEMKEQVDELEKSLRSASRNAEADRLRREFDDWVRRVSGD